MQGEREREREREMTNLLFDPWTFRWATEDMAVTRACAVRVLALWSGLRGGSKFQSHFFFFRHPAVVGGHHRPPAIPLEVHGVPSGVGNVKVSHYRIEIRSMRCEFGALWYLSCCVFRLRLKDVQDCVQGVACLVRHRLHFGQRALLHIISVSLTKEGCLLLLHQSAPCHSQKAPAAASSAQCA